MPADCHITNTGGTLVFQPISWEERQNSRPSIRSVPRNATQHLDPDTYLIEVKTIDFTARLTDAEKTTLMAIFNANAKVTLQLYNAHQAGTWTYTGWLQRPQMNFEYKVENGANIRWWKCTLEVLVDTVSGPTSSGVQQINDGSFEDNDGWMDGYNSNPVSGSTDQARTGTHSLFLYSNYVIQVTPISVAKSTIGSFGFWFIAPITNTDTSYIIYYTDSTDSGVIAIPAGDYFSWTYFDILSQVGSGKSVAYIGFYGDSTNPTYVDDVSLITNSQSGLSDTTGVLLGAGALDATGIYLGFVTGFERVHEKNVQVSNWLNQAPTTQISYTFFDNKLVKLNYTFRASDEDKYYLDQMILLHELVSLTDLTNIIYNTDSVWISEIDSRYTSDNWDRPWIISIGLLTEAITTPSVTLYTYETNGCWDTEIDSGIITIDGTPYTLLGLPLVISGLADGTHTILYTPNNGYFVDWSGSGSISVDNIYINPSTITVTNSAGVGVLSARGTP
jgi:hypothetical protein